MDLMSDRIERLMDDLCLSQQDSEGKVVSRTAARNSSHSFVNCDSLYVEVVAIAYDLLISSSIPCSHAWMITHRVASDIRIEALLAKHSACATFNDRPSSSPTSAPAATAKVDACESRGTNGSDHDQLPNPTSPARTINGYNAAEDELQNGNIVGSTNGGVTMASSDNTSGSPVAVKRSIGSSIDRLPITKMDHEALSYLTVVACVKLVLMDVCKLLLGAPLSNCASNGGIPPANKTSNSSLVDLAQLPTYRFYCHSLRGTKRVNEDRLVAMPQFDLLWPDCDKSIAKDALFAVFDGHGGNQCSQFASSHLLHELQPTTSTAAYIDDPEGVIQGAYGRLDNAFSRLCQTDSSCKSGSTCVCALYHSASDTFYVSWVGDSLALLVSENDSCILTYPHDLNNDEEVKRAIDDGGFVFNMGGKRRLQGALLVTRSFGDFAYKPPVSADPGIELVTLSPENLFLVLASDGLWDVVAQDDVAEICKTFQATRQDDDAANLAQLLTNKAKLAGTTDDCTVVVIDLLSMRAGGMRSEEA